MHTIQRQLGPDLKWIPTGFRGTYHAVAPSHMPVSARMPEIGELKTIARQKGGGVRAATRARSVDRRSGGGGGVAGCSSKFERRAKIRSIETRL